MNAERNVTPAAAAVFAELMKLAAPLRPSDDGVRVCNWFTGTRDDARACALLAGLGLPGDPGQNKVSWTATIGGRRVAVTANGKARIRALIQLTDAEEKLISQEKADLKGAKEAMAKAAEFDKKATAAEAELKEWPATEEEFRQRAADMLWRLWTALEASYGRRDAPHPSGFCFDKASMRNIEGYFLAARWALEYDGEVTYDDAVRMEKVRKARSAAAKHDFPLQRVLKAAACAASQGVGAGEDPGP